VSNKQSISYLLQVALPFILLGSFKNSIFFLPVIIILIALPFKSQRNNLIKCWQKIGFVLSQIVSPLVLSFIYYFAITPLSIIKRLTSPDLLALKPPPQTNFKEVSIPLKKDDFENLW